MVTMPKDEFEELLERVAERGARAALSDVGLDGENAANDIRELRGLLEAFTTSFLLALVAGALIKLRVFGGAQ
jgi:hypothetical protein